MAGRRRPRPLEPFPAAIWDKVEEHGSHAKFAKTLGVSPVTVMNWESGTSTPDQENQEKLIESGLDRAVVSGEASKTLDQRLAHMEWMMEAAIRNQDTAARHIEGLTKAVNSLEESVRRQRRRSG